MTKHALLIVGSRTAENRYGVISGQRVATALSSRGWSISTIHATDGHDILRHLLTQPTDVVVPVGFGAPTETGDIAAISRLVGVPCAGPSPSVGNLIQDKEAFSRLVATMFLPETMVRSPVGFSINPDTTGEEMRSQIARLLDPGDGNVTLSTLQRAAARSIASCAIFSPSSVCVFSHSENASCAAPSTNPAA